MTRRPLRRLPMPHGIGEMLSPARCRHCAKVYDLAKVVIVGRYLDCSVWHCPGCDLQVDDRGEHGDSAWGRSHYDRIERATGGLDMYGRPLDRDS